MDFKPSFAKIVLSLSFSLIGLNFAGPALTSFCGGPFCTDYGTNLLAIVFGLPMVVMYLWNISKSLPIHFIAIYAYNYLILSLLWNKLTNFFHRPRETISNAIKSPNYKPKKPMNKTKFVISIIVLCIIFAIGISFIDTGNRITTAPFDNDILTQLENEMTKKLENSNSRLQFNKDIYESERGKTLFLYYGIYNNVGANENTFNVTFDSTGSVNTCLSSLGSGDPKDITLKTIPYLNIESNKVKLFPLKVDINPNTLPDTYLCQIIVKSGETGENYAEKTITIIIK